MKDVPMVLPEGLVLGCVPAREVYATACFLAPMPTPKRFAPRCPMWQSSLRRQAQILALRPEFKKFMLRGNVDTACAS